jgi:glucosylceramidase
MDVIRIMFVFHDSLISRPSRVFRALLASVMLCAAPAAHAELLTNPAFADVNGDGNYGDGWASFGTAGFHDFFGGNPHASLFSDQASNAGGVFQAGIPGSAGDEFTLALTNVRIEVNADADFVFGLEYYAGDDATKLGESLVAMDLGATGDGLSFSMSATAPAGTAYVRPLVRFDNVRSTVDQQENVFVFSASLTVEEAAAVDDIQLYLTRGDQVSLLEQRPDLTFTTGNGTHTVKINVDPSVTYQVIDGFGAAVTDSSAWLIQNELSAAQRTSLMNDLFSADAGIGISMVRLPMGASDFALTPYTYDDMPSGQTDLDLSEFSIAYDQAHIVPTLQQAAAISGHLKIIASPWSPPAWMKNTQTLWGGSLLSQYYAVYADYFVRFVQAYAAEGLPIYAVTPQNEPLNSTTAMPAATMQTYQQSAFVGDHLGPAFASAGITSKILVFDHNWADWSYPVVVMNDPEAGQYAAGAAFHGYDGDVSQQSDFHTYHPDAEIHFTEISGGGWSTDFASNLMWGTRTIILGATRNWSRSCIFWNLALDQNDGPRIGGCENCRGVVTINTHSGAVTREVEYYIIGHAAKFVQPGAQRIASTNVSDTIETVAFHNPDGSEVLLAVNPQGASQWFDVVVGDEYFAYRLPGQSVVTFIWQGVVPGDFDGNGLIEFDDIDDGASGNQNSLFDFWHQAPPSAAHDLAPGGASAGVIDYADLIVLVEQLLGSQIGDLDRDSTVSMADLAILLGSLGGSGGYFAGDLNGDGAVNLLDFAILQQTVGATAAGA